MTLEQAKSDLEKNVLLQDLMKKANAILRKKIAESEKTKLLIDAGWDANLVPKLLKPDFANRIGFPQYQLTSLNQKINKLKSKVLEFEKTANTHGYENKTYLFDGGSVVIDINDDRVRIFHDSKPSTETIADLKKSGWKWSPSNKAWQRQKTDNAILNAIRLTGAKLDENTVNPEILPITNIDADQANVNFENKNFTKATIYSFVLQRNLGRNLSTLNNIVVFTHSAVTAKEMIEKWLLKQFTEDQIKFIKVYVYPQKYSRECKQLYKQGAYLPNDNLLYALEESSKIDESVNLEKSDKIQMEKISIDWAEHVGDYPKVAYSWKEANDFTLPIAEQYIDKTESGYTKIGFTITWKDGETYQGRLEMDHKYDNPNLKKYHNNVFGVHLLESAEHRIKNKREGYEDYQQFLEKYDLGIEFNSKNQESIILKTGLTPDDVDVDIWNLLCNLFPENPEALKLWNEGGDNIASRGRLFQSKTLWQITHNDSNKSIFKTVISGPEIKLNFSGDDLARVLRKMIVDNEVEHIDALPEQEFIFDPSNYKNQFELNEAIRDFIIQNNLTVANCLQRTYTEEEIKFVRCYTGYGGLGKFDKEGKADVLRLTEFYTPSSVVETMWKLAYKNGYKANQSVLEPSAGTGEFLKFLKKGTECTALEISKFSSVICKILHPDVNVINAPFEQMFIEKNYTVKHKVAQKYDLVIGNPPYSSFDRLDAAAAQLLAMGEKDYTMSKNYVEYFIRRSIDLLKPGGLLVFIVGAEVMNGGILFLDSENSPVKIFLQEKTQLLEAYRLPSGIFENTNVVSEIIVLKKK